MDFLDTNVLVYAYDHGSPAKRRIARQLIDTADRATTAVSVQVLAEFSNIMLKRLGAHPAAVSTAMDALALHVVIPDADLVHRAVEAYAR